MRFVAIVESQPDVLEAHVESSVQPAVHVVRAVPAGQHCFAPDAAIAHIAWKLVVSVVSTAVRAVKFVGMTCSNS
ncbi:hypothetical protein D1872_272040 [compost metagenome]